MLILIAEDLVLKHIDVIADQTSYMGYRIVCNFKTLVFI